MLIIFGGLSATGKTTLARLVARRLGAAYLRIDTMEDAMRQSNALKEDVGTAGYIVAYGVAADNLAIGTTVVADSVNPLTVTRDAWLRVATGAGCRAFEIEVVCSDSAEHRRRLTTRKAVTEGRTPLKWEDVTSREYDVWTRQHLVIDTSTSSPNEAVETILNAISAAP